MEISNVNMKIIIGVVASIVVVSICLVFVGCCRFLNWCGRMLKDFDNKRKMSEQDEELANIVSTDPTTYSDHGACENDTRGSRGSAESLVKPHRNLPNSSQKYHAPAPSDSGNFSSQYPPKSRPSSGEIKAPTSSSQWSSTTSGTRNASGGRQHTSKAEVSDPSSLAFWAGDICLPILTSNEIETMIGGPINQVKTDLKGGFGHVFGPCYYSLHDAYVAIKIMKGVIRNEEEAEGVTQSFKDEIIALFRLRHDAIVVVKAMCLSPMAIVLEWVEGGSLQKAVEEKSLTELKNDSPLTELKNVLTILKDVAKGLEYIHSMDMVHRDIKPHNILLSPDRNRAKIADFGLAKIAKLKADEESAQCSTGPAMGTEAYSDPDYKESKKPRRHHDVYSFGLTIMMCLSGSSHVSTLKEKLLAYDPEIGDPSKLRDMLHKNFREGPTRECSVAVKLLHLARKCIDPDPQKRPVTKGIEKPGALFLPSQLTQLLHKLTTEDSDYDATGLNTELLAKMPEEHRQALTQQLQRHCELVEDCQRCNLDGVHDRFGNVVGVDKEGKPKKHYDYYGSTIVYAVECGVLRLAVDIKEHANCNYKGNAVKHRLCVHLDRGMSFLKSTRALANDKALFKESEDHRKFYEDQIAQLSKYSEETRKPMEAKLMEQRKQAARRAHQIPIEDVLKMVNHHRLLVRALLKEKEKGQLTLSNTNMKKLTNFSNTIKLVEKLREPQGNQPARLRPDFITDERISELKIIRNRGNDGKHNMSGMDEEEGKHVDKLNEIGLMSAKASSSR